VRAARFHAPGDIVHVDGGAHAVALSRAEARDALAAMGGMPAGDPESADG